MGGTFASDVVGGLVNGAIDSETARLLGGQGANGRQIVEDAFGNALGNAAIAAISAPEDKQAPPDHINTMSREDIASPTGNVNDIHVDLSSDGSISGVSSAGSSLPSVIGHTPVTNLPEIVVGPNARNNQEFMDNYWWALENHYAPPTTTNPAGLSAYRQGAMQAWTQRVQNYYDEYKSRPKGDGGN